MSSFQKHIRKSLNLRQLSICGMKFGRVAFRMLGRGIQESMVLKRFLIQNTNLGARDNLHALTEGIMKAKSVEFVDFQLNNLENKHVSSIAKLICSQYEIRDLLRWKLGLRSPHILDITKLGIKHINVSRNNFGDYFAEQLSLALKADEYTKCLIIKHNKIGFNGIKFLAEAVFQHPGLLSLDLRQNPGYANPETHKFKLIMRNSFISNIKHDVKEFCRLGNRINCEFIVPDCLGLSKNNLDLDISKSSPEQRRIWFVELLTIICSATKLNWSTVLTAVFGQHVSKKDSFRRQLEILRVNKRPRSVRKSSNSPVTIKKDGSPINHSGMQSPAGR